MSKKYSGQIHVRISPQLHEEIAREAFENRTSISGICAQALMLRNTFLKVNGDKALKEIWESNKNVDPDQLNTDIEDAIKAIRSEQKRA